jgi:secretion monitor
MVAASLGLPALSNGHETATPAKATASNHNPSKVNFSSWRCWRRIAGPTLPSTTGISTPFAPLFVISLRHGAAGVAGGGRNFPLQAQHLALLDTLSALLTQDSTPPVVIRQAAYIPSSYSAFRVSAWISQVAGIRAGPQRLS